MTGLSMTGTPVEDCIPSDEDSHSIGTVMFGTDGSLFVGSGDGSNYTDVDRRALRSQNLNSLAGKIMRIDPATGQWPARQSLLRRQLPAVQPLQGLRAGAAEPVPLHHPSGDQRALHRRCRLEQLGGDQHGQGRQLRLAVLRGRRRRHPRAGESSTTTSLQLGSYACSADTSRAVQRRCTRKVWPPCGAPVFAYNHDGTDGYGLDGRRVGERRLLLHRDRLPARSTRTRCSSSTTTGAGSAT